MTSAAASAPPARFSRFVRDSALFSLGTAVGKAAALLTLPIVTRKLQPDAYGELEVVSTLMSAVTSLLILGLDTAVTRLYPQLDLAARRRMFATWALLAVAITVPFAGVMALAREPLSELLVGAPGLGPELVLAGLFIAVTSLQLVSLTVLRNEGRAGRFAAITAGALVINAVLVVVLLQIDASVRSVLLANVLSQACGAAAGLWMTRGSYRARPATDTAERMLRLGLPLVPAAAALLAGEVLLRTILFNASSDVEAGYYGIGVRFASIVVLGVVGLQTAWQPRAFAALDRADGMPTIAADARRIVSMVALAAVAVATVAPTAVVLVGGDSFTAADSAVAWMLMWALVFGLYQVATMPSAIAERMGDIGISGAIGMGIAVVGTIIVAAEHGAAGTAAALAFGQFVAVLVAAGLGARRTSVPFAIAPMGRVALAAAAAIAATALGAGLWLRLALAGLVVAIVVADGSLSGLGSLVSELRRRGRSSIS